MKPRILVAPLNWGLGHATRCVPLVNRLIDLECEVFIAGSGRALAYLVKEFPDLNIIEFDDYHITYPKRRGMVWKMFRLLPFLLKRIRKENIHLSRVVKRYQIDGVISDNRFGLWSKEVASVFISHQIGIKMPKWLKWLEGSVYMLNRWVINHYDFCWIPDYEGKVNLSGDLSHNRPLPHQAKFIGPLSRFNNEQEINFEEEEKEYDFVAVLSGPEPQRSLLEEKIVRQLKDSNYRGVIIQGKTEVDERKSINDRVEIISNADSSLLLELIKKSDIVISRSGYSSLMDWVTLGVNALLIPTPGQTEQEYLAQYYDTFRVFQYQSQQQFDISKIFEIDDQYKGLKINYSFNLLDEAINEFLEKIRSF